MISIHNLSKSFGHHKVVDDISFSVKPGEVLGFLGPNGAGKSTTMKMLTGFLTPSSGWVDIFGRNLQREPLACKAMLGYLPEGAPCYADMNVGSFLNFIAQARGLSAKQQAKEVARTLEQLQLDRVLEQKIDTLSKGFKRRVGLAQAILHDPGILILDEPTDGLDPNQKHQVRKLIANLAADKIVIISTHILEEVTAVCSRAIIINEGKLVTDASPAELVARSRYHGALRLQLADNNGVAEALNNLTEAAQVDSLTDHSWLIFPKSGQNLFASVNALIQQHHWQVEELHMETGRLDEVFRDVTGNAEQGA